MQRNTVQNFRIAKDLTRSSGELLLPPNVFSRGVFGTALAALFMGNKRAFQGGQK
jgi:hypothetical protein